MGYKSLYTPLGTPLSEVLDRLSNFLAFWQTVKQDGWIRLYENHRSISQLRAVHSQCAADTHRIRNTPQLSAALRSGTHDYGAASHAAKLRRSLACRCGALRSVA